jgi:hypothetical protein
VARDKATMRTILAAAFLAVFLVAFVATSARAEVSANDGYASNGAYEWHVELAPYGWVPATSVHIKLGNGAAANVNTGIPAVSELRNVVTGAFMDFGLVRYGPLVGADGYRLRLPLADQGAGARVARRRRAFARCQHLARARGAWLRL